MTATTITGRPATERQRSFATRLVDERGGDVYALGFPGILVERAFDLVADPSKFVSTREASAVIDHLLHLARASAAEAPAPTRASAAPGFYVRGDDAFKVQANKAGTGTYALRWDGRSWEYAPGIGRDLADLTPMTGEQAAALGLASGRCINCCRTLGGDSLSAKVSALIGYGETCAGHQGWTYPTGAEAQRAYIADRTADVQ